MSSQNEYDSRIQLTKFNKKRYTKLEKIDISSPLLDTIFGSVRILSTHVVLSGYLYGHVCDGWYSDPLCRTLCRYVGSKKCFMVPLSLIIIIQKLILSANFFFFRIGFLRKSGRSGYQKRRIKKVHRKGEKKTTFVVYYQSRSEFIQLGPCGPLSSLWSHGNFALAQWELVVWKNDKEFTLWSSYWFVDIPTCVSKTRDTSVILRAIARALVTQITLEFARDVHDDTARTTT